MTDYIEITDTQIEPDAPLTAVLAAQWRDNPIAIAEGADGAPRLARKIIYTSTPSAALSGLSGYQGCKIDCYMVSGVECSVQLQFSSDGSTWPAVVTVLETAAPGGSISANIYVDFDDGAYLIVPREGIYSSGTISSMPAAPTHIRFAVVSGTLTSGRIVVQPDGGTSAS